LPWPWRRLSSSYGAKPAFGCSTLILLVTGSYLAVGLAVFAAWLIGGHDAWIEDFFRTPGALLLVWLAALGTLFSVRVCRGFSPGEPMREAWQLIALSAGSGLAGSVLIQVFGAKSRLNPLNFFPGGTEHAPAWRSMGLVLDGPCRFALLAAALFLVLRLYRQSGFLGRYTAMDWVVLAGFGVYVVREAAEVVVAFRHGKPFALAEILNFPVDPLLWVLLAEALRLLRSVHMMGTSWIGKCYGAFSAGIFLILIGDVAIWATQRGYLPWPWAALGWYAWIPAAGAFALAPSYQWEAMRHAESSRAADAPAV
jgi:hypothetical protein